MRPGRVIKVGITGGIGSGKSTVCRMFSMLGVDIYDSDEKAKMLMSSDKGLIGSIIRVFGEEAYIDGKLNRSYLAERVFGNKDALERLNMLVHPAVIRDFRKWAAREREDTYAGYVIMESAIILDADLSDELDYVITVSSPEELRIERSMERDSVSREEIESRMANQMSDEEREERADFVIENDEKRSVWEQVLDWDRFFRVNSFQSE